MEKKFDKYKKRKTRIRKVSDTNYVFNPTHNNSSPSQAASFPITQLKLENKSDYLYDVDIIMDFVEDMIDKGFRVTSHVIVGRVGVPEQERGDIYKIKEFLDKVPSWSVGTINYGVDIESGKDLATRKRTDAFDIIKEGIESLRGRLNDMTNCRVDSVSIRTENGYREQYQNNGSISTSTQTVHASINISNIKSKRSNKLEK